MPAHGALHTIGLREKSDGCPVTSLDWRANRLADAVAKAGAACVRTPASARILNNRVRNAYEHALVKLAAVTVAANRHETSTIHEDGTATRVILRDAACSPQAKRQRTYSTHPSSNAIASSSTHEHTDGVLAPLLANTTTVSGTPPKRPSSFAYAVRCAKRRRMDRDHAVIAHHRELASWREALDSRIRRPVSVA